MKDLGLCIYDTKHHELWKGSISLVKLVSIAGVESRRKTIKDND